MNNAGLNRVASLSLPNAVSILAVAWAVACAPVPAAAQGTPEQQQACQPDAMRLCSEFIPDVPSITKCMDRNRASLSPACRAVFTKPAADGRRPERR
jgi:hypothetical protein